MSENHGTNLKNKISRMINIFLELKTFDVQKDNNDKKKRKKNKKKKNNEDEKENKEKDQNSMNTSQHSELEDYYVGHLNMNNIDDLWEYMT